MGQLAVQTDALAKSYKRFWFRTSLARCLKNLSFQAKVRPVFEQISLSLSPGMVYGLFGKNGKGKTTLLKLLAGIIRPTSGTVTVHGRIAPVLSTSLGAHGILTVKANIDLLHSFYNPSNLDRPPNYQKILSLAGLSEEWLDEYFAALSYGTGAKVCIATAFYADADIYLMDEVFSSLDQESRERFVAEVKRLAEKGKTFLIVSHNERFLTDTCNEIIHFDKLAAPTVQSCL